MNKTNTFSLIHVLSCPVSTIVRASPVRLLPVIGVWQGNSRQKYPTFKNQFFAQPYISEIVWGIRKKMFKKFYEQYLMNQHGPEPALVEN
jgi:hypothetical protein